MNLLALRENWIKKMRMGKKGSHVLLIFWMKQYFLKDNHSDSNLT